MTLMSHLRPKQVSLFTNRIGETNACMHAQKCLLVTLAFNRNGYGHGYLVSLICSICAVSVDSSRGLGSKLKRTRTDPENPLPHSWKELNKQSVRLVF